MIKSYIMNSSIRKSKCNGFQFFVWSVIINKFWSQILFISHFYTLTYALSIKM